MEYFTKKQIGLIQGECGYIEHISLSRDEKHLSITGYKGLMIWSLSTHSKVAKRTFEHWNDSNAFFHPNNQLIVTRDANNILILDIFTLKTVDKIPVKDIGEVFVSPNGLLLLASVSGGYIAFDLSTKQEVANVQLKDILGFEPSERITSVAWGPQTRWDEDQMGFDAANNYICGATKTGYVVTIENNNFQVVNILWHLPVLDGANFTDAMGMDDKLAKQLIAHGAIVEENK